MGGLIAGGVWQVGRRHGEVAGHRQWVKRLGGVDGHLARHLPGVEPRGNRSRTFERRETDTVWGNHFHTVRYWYLCANIQWPCNIDLHAYTRSVSCNALQQKSLCAFPLVSTHLFSFFLMCMFCISQCWMLIIRVLFVFCLFCLFVYLIRTNSLRLKWLMTIRVLTVDGREFHMYTKNPRADF